MKKVRDWIFSIPFFIAFGLSLLVFDIAGRIVRPFSLRGFEYLMGALQRVLVWTFMFTGTRVELTVSPAIEKHTGYVLISNHQSLFDIAMIGGLLITNFPKYVAKHELARWIPAISLNLRKGGNTVIDRGQRTESVRRIRQMAKTAQERNVSVVIFPEGTRSRDGGLMEFKPAGSLALLSAADQLPVVPVAIDGAWRLMKNNGWPIPFGTRVTMEFGDPIPRQHRDAEDRLADAHRWIEGRLRTWQSEAALPD